MACGGWVELSPASTSKQPGYQLAGEPAPCCPLAARRLLSVLLTSLCNVCYSQTTLVLGFLTLAMLCGMLFRALVTV